MISTPDEKPTPLERPNDNVNLNISVLISTPDEKPTPLERPNDNVNPNIGVLISTPDEKPTPLERPNDNVNLNISVLISTPDEGTPLWKGHISGVQEVASQKGFYCMFTWSATLENTNTDIKILGFVPNGESPSIHLSDIPSTNQTF